MKENRKKEKERKKERKTGRQKTGKERKERARYEEFIVEGWSLRTRPDNHHNFESTSKSVGSPVKRSKQNDCL